MSMTAKPEDAHGPKVDELRAFLERHGDIGEEVMVSSPIRTNFCPGCKTLADENAALKARVEALEVAGNRACNFLNDLARADLDELAADGGITVGMVFQQQAKWEATKLARQALKGTPHAE